MFHNKERGDRVGEDGGLISPSGAKRTTTNQVGAGRRTLDSDGRSLGGVLHRGVESQGKSTCILQDLCRKRKEWETGERATEPQEQVARDWP